VRYNGAKDDTTGQRWLVRYVGCDDEQEAWVPRQRLPLELFLKFEDARQVAFNKSFEPLLTERRSQHPSGVVTYHVSPADANKLVSFLRTNWNGPQLTLTSGKTVYGWRGYGKTLEPQDAEQQAMNSLLLTHALIPAVREHLPGFHAIELALTAWLNERFSTDVELFYAHGLRQSPKTLKSTGFDVHQDTEDFDLIEYTVVVKLTADNANEPASKMRVVGAKVDFEYDAPAGSCGLFRARLYHASVWPRSPREHLKIAYFFTKRGGSGSSGGSGGGGGDGGSGAADGVANGGTATAVAVPNGAASGVERRSRKRAISPGVEVR